jgi:hypothetical protein
MGLKLLLFGWYTPKYIIRRELANVSNLTITALQSLVTQYTPQGTEVYNKLPKSSDITAQRANMAQVQAKLVESLKEILGHDEAVRLGRDALFLVGQNLGRQTRVKLGVGDNPKDLVQAAKILYHILGITFHLEWLDSSNAVAVIDRCALSEHYSKLTCEALSATDEGVISGLQPNVTMHFREYLTGGCRNCRADIYFNQKATLT